MIKYNTMQHEYSPSIIKVSELEFSSKLLKLLQNSKNIFVTYFVLNFLVFKFLGH